MKIKDVEKLTGLSQRSIRLYEEKGLIYPCRDEENQYRSYTDDDLEKLKLIRVMRYFDFSIEEIGALLSEQDSSAIINALSQKAEHYADIVDDTENKAKECRQLLKDIKNSNNKNESKDAIDSDVLDDYIEMMETLDDEVSKELKAFEKQLKHPSLGATIIWTIILSGPIIGVLIGGIDSKLGTLSVIASTVLITIDWMLYIRGRSRRAEYQKKRDKDSFWKILAILVSIVLMFVVFISTSEIKEVFLRIVQGDNWIFYEDKRVTVVILIILTGILVTTIIYNIIYKLTGSIFYDMSWLNEIVAKYKYVLLAVALIFLYAFATDMTVYTGNTIIDYDAFHPAGVEYPLSDIKSIETGIGKSSFYYILNIESGEKNKKIRFEGPTANEKYYPNWEDGKAYIEMLDFDSKLMEMGIPKTADVGSLDNAIYSEECMEAFRQIVKESP